MGKVVKILLACVLTATLGLATVVCCCIAPAVSVLFHKAVACSHCAADNGRAAAPNAAKVCLQQLTSGDLLAGWQPAAPRPAAFTLLFYFLLGLLGIFAQPGRLLYPPGPPPPGPGLAPLYLRTYQLRI